MAHEGKKYRVVIGGMTVDELGTPAGSPQFMNAAPVTYEGLDYAGVVMLEKEVIAATSGLLTKLNQFAASQIPAKKEKAEENQVLLLAAIDKIRYLCDFRFLSD